MENAMIQTTTIDDIVNDLLFKLDKEDLDFLINPPAADTDKSKQLEYIWGRTSFMRSIRNEYGLWHTHPLTQRWRTDGPNDLRDGVDYSSDHPDNVSAQVFGRLVERVKASRK